MAEPVLCRRRGSVNSGHHLGLEATQPGRKPQPHDTEAGSPPRAMQSLCTSVSWGSEGKMSACNAGDPGSIPGLGRSPGEGKGYPLQYSGLENSMSSIVHGVTKNWTPLSDYHFWFQFSSVTQSCLPLCDPMNRSTPCLPVHHQLPEFTQTQTPSSQ